MTPRSGSSSQLHGFILPALKIVEQCIIVDNDDHVTTKPPEKTNDDGTWFIALKQPLERNERERAKEKENETVRKKIIFLSFFKTNGFFPLLIELYTFILLFGFDLTTIAQAIENKSAKYSSANGR